MHYLSESQILGHTLRQIDEGSILGQQEGESLQGPLVQLVCFAVGQLAFGGCGGKEGKRIITFVCVAQ